MIHGSRDKYYAALEEARSSCEEFQDLGLRELFDKEALSGDEAMGCMGEEGI